MRWYRALSSSSSAKIGTLASRKMAIAVRNRASVVASAGVEYPESTRRRASSTLRSSILGRISVENRRWSASFSGSAVSIV